MIHSFSLAVLFPISFLFRQHKRHNIDDVVNKRIPSRGYQELFFKYIL
jgi:hypothetical protein